MAGASTGTGAAAAGAGAQAPAAARQAFEERLTAELGALKTAVIDCTVQRPHRLLANVKQEGVADVCRRLKGLGFEHLSCLTCVDYGTELEMIILLWSYKHACLIELRCRTPGTDPKFPSLTPVWTGAEFHEREAYDMFGVVFEGCPNLTRVLLPDEWSLFPLRKSFKIESIHEKRKRLEAEKTKEAKARAAAAAAAAPAPGGAPPAAQPQEAAQR